MSIAPVLKRVNEGGLMEYHLDFDPVWDGLDSFVNYLKKHWQAEVIESVDDIYSRRWVLRVKGVSISVYHDGQIGNYFVREDGEKDQSVLEDIEADLVRRMG
ncbi:MAG: hypothetical protein ABW166_21450 [Sedimenticola sp.]